MSIHSLIRKRTLISLFSGAGGLDLGFYQAGFTTLYANEYDKQITPTFKYNFPDVYLNTGSITDIHPDDLPDVTGFIGGPPCQSWSEAGSRKGINDKRGQLFYDYIRLLETKQPLFFVAENVKGILHQRHREAFTTILKAFEEANYYVTYQVMNTVDYEVPQDRERVIIIGLRKDCVPEGFPLSSLFPEPCLLTLNLSDAIDDLQTLPLNSGIMNHDITDTGYSSQFMSRNRVRQWHQPSFTIVASDRHTPLHPQAPVMKKISQDVFTFEKGNEHLYRRLSVRECARIQTFPDYHEFMYQHPRIGYKMVGNAVPVRFAYHIARHLDHVLTTLKKDSKSN